MNELSMKVYRLNTIKDDATATTNAIVAMFAAVSAGKSMKASIAEFFDGEVEKKAARLERMAKAGDLPAHLERVTLEQVHNLTRMVSHCARNKGLFMSSGEDTQLVCVDLLSELADEAMRASKSEQYVALVETATRITTTTGYTLDKVEGDDTGSLFWTVARDGNPIANGFKSLLRLCADGTFTDGNEATGLVLKWAGEVQPNNTMSQATSLCPHCGTKVPHSTTPTQQKAQPVALWAKDFGVDYFDSLERKEQLIGLLGQWDDVSYQHDMVPSFILHRFTIKADIPELVYLKLWCGFVEEDWSFIANVSMANEDGEWLCDLGSADDLVDLLKEGVSQDKTLSVESVDDLIDALQTLSQTNITSEQEVSLYQKYAGQL